MANIGNKIIRSNKDLPKWFDLKKYAKVKDLDAAGWYEILLQRQNHFFWFKQIGIEEYTKEKDSAFYTALLQSRENPLSLLTDEVQTSIIGGGSLEDLKNHRKNFTTFSNSISPLTVRQLYKLEYQLKKETRSRIRPFFDRLFDNYSSIKLTEQYKEELNWALSFIDKSIFEIIKNEHQEDSSYKQKRNYDYVHIDLSIPDKILIDQFTNYLQNIRKNNPDIKPANQYKLPEYKKWAEYGLLPYLDLLLWEKESNVSIPYRVMADAIFSDGEKGEEIIRKTTKKLAESLMHRDYIDFLETIVAQEITEKL